MILLVYLAFQATQGILDSQEHLDSLGSQASQGILVSRASQVIQVIFQALQVILVTLAGPVILATQAFQDIQDILADQDFLEHQVGRAHQAILATQAFQVTLDKILVLLVTLVSQGILVFLEHQAIQQ